MHSGGTVHSLAGVVASGRIRDLTNPYLLLSGVSKWTLNTDSFLPSPARLWLTHILSFPSHAI